MQRIPDPDELEITRLGPCRVPSPLRESRRGFVREERRVLVCSDLEELRDGTPESGEPAAFEPAGPRSRLFFDPGKTRCGIVTCGGLCPGINDVIRSIVLTLHHLYGVGETIGFRYGFDGLDPEVGHDPAVLTPEVVGHIHQWGGTILGSSRGPHPMETMVETLLHHEVDVLFAIGGDGTLKGASALARELRRRNLPMSVVGVPKTIDNDLPWIDRSFGFVTAVDEAARAIHAAHTEARGAWNGIGLVKLMGRLSGLIAAHASLANSDVNFCLVPEMPFTLDGEGGFLEALERRLEARRHAVIVVAEGAGQDLLRPEGEMETDASGNPKLYDIGTHLKERIRDHLEDRGLDFTVKYIDPSYMVRSLPANTVDSEYCLALGQHAAHAAMAGRTDMLVGRWRGRFCHVPLSLVVGERRQIDPEGVTWQRVLAATGQPPSMMGHVAAG